VVLWKVLYILGFRRRHATRMWEGLVADSSIHSPDPYSLSEVSFTEIPLDDHTMMPLETFKVGSLFIWGLKLNSCLYFLQKWIILLSVVVWSCFLLLVFSFWQLLWINPIEKSIIYSAKEISKTVNVWMKYVCLLVVDQQLVQCPIPNTQCPINHSFF